uniref:Uncharacterized protein n=1 Tax=Chrysotila carterae TaxID=13221 RepID=A0A7S4B6H7_CHRCT
MFSLSFSHLYYPAEYSLPLLSLSLTLSFPLSILLSHTLSFSSSSVLCVCAGSFVEHLHRPGQRASTADDCANPNLVAVTRKTPLDMFGKGKRHVTPVDLFGRGRKLERMRKFHDSQGEIVTSAKRQQLT